MSKCGVYLACPMTGYDKQDMLEFAKYADKVAREYGLEPWSPILHENIEGIGKLENNKSDLEWKWPMDKEALNNLFIFVNLRADAKSFGCEDEYGRQRYSEWQPSFKISPKHAAGYVSIANYQADGVFGDIHTCFAYIQQHFGTRKQRIQFKLKVWMRSGLPWILRQLRRLGQ